MVTNKKSSVVYVDHTILTLLSAHTLKDDPVFADWQAIRTIWRKLREEAIRVVTHGKDTEMDIILWLNGQGCCITDTLRAMEAIKEFELWGKDEKSRIQQYKQILAYFEEIELLQLQPDNHTDDQEAKEIAAVFQQNNEEPHGNMIDIHRHHILGTCLSEIGKWYTSDLWSDLKRTDYQLNWQILESILAREGIEPLFRGEEGAKNRYLFGLLNRAVGLAKKSCGKLPVPDNHINFVVTMVLQKYGDDQVSRGIRHLMHCVKSHIDFYVTVNYRLAQSFNANKQAFQESLKLTSLNIALFTPRRFVAQVLGEDEGI